MAPEVARLAFEPFLTTKGPTDGTGLGLATVYGAVTQAGGQVRLVSGPGDGTTFDVHLPAADGIQRAVEAPVDVPVRRRTILPTEDEAAPREVIGRIPRTAGHDVVDAATPAEALDRDADGARRTRAPCRANSWAAEPVPGGTLRRPADGYTPQRWDYST